MEVADLGEFLIISMFKVGGHPGLPTLSPSSWELSVVVDEVSVSSLLLLDIGRGKVGTSRTLRPVPTTQINFSTVLF